MRRHPVIGYEMLKGVRFLPGPPKLSTTTRARRQGIPAGPSWRRDTSGVPHIRRGGHFRRHDLDRPYRRALPWEAARDEMCAQWHAIRPSGSGGVLAGL